MSDEEKIDEEREYVILLNNSSKERFSGDKEINFFN